MTLRRFDEPRRRISIWHSALFASFLFGHVVFQIGSSPSCSECFCGQACAELRAVDAATVSCTDFRALLLLTYFPEPNCENTFFSSAKYVLAARCGAGSNQTKHQCNFVEGLSRTEEVVSAIALIISFISVVRSVRAHH